MTIWEDPPTPRLVGQAKRLRNRELLADLKEHAGKWALAESGLKPRQAYTRSGSWRRDYGCEARLSMNDDGTRNVYVRWVDQ